jgi:DnaK suppressor protein
MVWDVRRYRQGWICDFALTLWEYRLMSEAVASTTLAAFEDMIEAASSVPPSVVAEVVLPEQYRPSAGEDFMNPRQLAYFRRKLLDWKDEILREARETLATLQSESLREPDVADRASSETDWSIELRTRDRQRKLISKIEAALRRIETGDYGYCEVTGEPISLQRLEARPIATMTLEAQEKHERIEKVTRDE